MISAWTLTALLPLIGSNIYALKKMQELRQALDTKEVLLGEEDKGSIVAAGGVLVWTLHDRSVRFNVKSSRWTRLDVSAEFFR